MTNTSSETRQVNCPCCKKPCAWTNNPYRPFCSMRCKDGDFIAWATETYKIGDNTADEETPFSGDLPH